MIMQIFIISSLCSYVLAVQFIFTPSPNIEVYQLAYYQCSVDSNDIVIIWYINGTRYNNSTIQPDIVINETLSSNSSLTILGYPQYNNTVVRCFAAGFVDGIVYNNFSQSTLRIQGQLAAVINLICHVQSQYINCSWSPPFSLISIPGYIINVTYGGELVTQDTTSSTTRQYCPSQFGNYTISVAGNNSAGEGEIRTTSVVVLKNKITCYEVIPVKSSNDTYLALFTVKTRYYSFPLSVSISLTNSNETKPFSTRNFNITMYRITGSINIGYDGRKKWRASLILRYQYTFLSSNDYSTWEMFSTFDVQRGSLTVLDNSTREIWFACSFLEGSQSQGCYIEYNSVITDYNGSLIINRIPDDASTASKCVTGIYTSNYNVTFYDMDYNNVPYTTEYAVKLTNVSVTGLSPPVSTSTSITPIATLPSSLPTSSKNYTSMGSVQGGLPVTIIIGLFMYNIIIYCYYFN